MAEAQDFQSLRDAIVAAIRADPAKAAIWTDLSPAGMGIILLEIAAHAGDLVSHSADRRAQENYLSSARLGESVRRIGRSLGYPVPTRTPASVSATLVVDEAFGVDITLPEMTFAAAGRQWYYAGGDVLAAGETSLAVVFSQAIKRTMSAAGTGLPWQTVVIPSTQGVRSSVQVVVDDVLWSVVNIIGLAEGSEYEVSVADDASLVVRFGNDVRGTAPASAAAIAVSWLDTDGASGAVGENALAGQLLSFWSAGAGTTVLMTVSESAAAIGAADDPSPTEIRALVMPWLRSCEVGVTAAAIEALAMAYSHPIYGRIAKAKAVLDEANLIRNAVRLTVASASGTTLLPVSSELKAALLAELNESKIMSVEYSITDPTFVEVNIECRVHPIQGVQDRAFIGDVRAVFVAAFSPANLALGGTVYLSDLYSALNALPKVEWAIITSHSDNIEPNAATGETLVLGTIEVTVV